MSRILAVAVVTFALAGCGVGGEWESDPGPRTPSPASAPAARSPLLGYSEILRACESGDRAPAIVNGTASSVYVTDVPSGGQIVQVVVLNGDDSREPVYVQYALPLAGYELVRDGDAIRVEGMTGGTHEGMPVLEPASISLL